MRALKYLWGVPVAAAVLWLGSLLQGEQPPEQPQLQWREQVDAQLEKLVTQQEALELQVRQLQQVRGPDLSGAIRDQTQKVTAELRNITAELRQSRRIR
jgi:hypothetical protein